METVIFVALAIIGYSSITAAWIAGLKIAAERISEAKTTTREMEDIMAEITLDQDKIIESVNRRITQDLAVAIKQVAKDGVWEEADEEEVGIDPEKIVRRTMATYMGMGGSVPGWFLEAVQATSYVLAADKMEGCGCISALHESTSKAPVGKRMAALTKLLAISTPIGFMSGIPHTPIA